MEAWVHKAYSVGMFGLVGAAMLLGGFANVGHADDVVAYEVVDDESIPDPLTGKLGDPDKGREAFINRKQGQLPWLP